MTQIQTVAVSRPQNVARLLASSRKVTPTSDKNTNMLKRFALALLRSLAALSV
jgi:hypothetical protein